MKFAAVSSLFLSTALGYVSTGWMSNEQQLVSNKAPGVVKIKAEIPGDSPIELCDDDEEQLIEIKSVVIEPNPPVAGQNLTVTAQAEVLTDIVEGSYIDVVVRYGFIQLINKRYDLCEILPEASLECPISKGSLTLTRSFEIPEQIPPGEYIVLARAFTESDELLTCLNADVFFDVEM